MRKNHLGICLGIILALGFSLPGCRNKAAEKQAAAATEESTPSLITLTMAAVKTAGIQTAEAVIRPFVRTIHAPGEIIFDPKRISHVTARAAGRIEQVLAYHGDRVQKGQVLLTLYSQDFLALQAELLQASDRLKRFELNPADRAAAQSLFESVKNKLRLLDIQDAELSDIEKTASPETLLPVRAPLSGSIIECSITNGDYVELGASLFRIGDISRVWVEIHIFEKDLARVRIGCEAVIHVSVYPGREFKGRLFQVGNVVDEKSRTVGGWIELPNPDGQLKPGMYIEADILSSMEANSIFVPGSAVQDYQNKKVVFVRTGENTFALREIETGISLDGFVEILKGLKERELVATSGSFFLKSELLKKSLGEE